MKFAIAFILFLALQTATNAYSQTTVTINLKSADFKKVLSAIERQTSYHFVYSERKIPFNKKIDVNVENQEVIKVLDQLFENSGFTYTELQDHLVVIFPTGENINVLKIKGKVIDETEKPLVGATIKVKGSSAGTITDKNGYFFIAIPDAGTLTISYIGYNSKEIIVKGDDPLTVTLSPSPGLAEVVITALGVKKEERRLGYSVTGIGGDEVSLTREPTFVNALEGKIAGMVIQSPSNGPGGSSRVILRGYSSFGGSNQPLYVVDGVAINSATRENTDDPNKIYGGFDPGDGLSSINPDDIESISVLKGASAAALYGGGAQAGVILITTKKGLKKAGWDIAFNDNTVLEKMVPYSGMQYQYGRGNDGKAYTAADNITNDVFQTAESWGAKIQGQQVLGADGKMEPYLAQSASTRFDKFFRTGFTTTNSIALAKNNGSGSTRVSLSDTKDNTPIPGSGYERYNAVIRSVQDYGKKLHTDFKLDASRMLRLNIPLLRGDDRGSFSKYFIRSDNTTDISFLDQKDANGNYLYTYTNPYFDIEKVKNDQTQDRILASGNVTYDISAHLHANLVTGIDWLTTDGLFAVYPNNKANNSGLLQSSSIKQQKTDVRGVLTYDNSFHDFTLNAFGGGELVNSIYNTLTLTGVDFVDPTLLNFNNVTAEQPVQTSVPRYKVNSVFAEAQLGYKNYLFLELTGRNDWYSSLASSRPNFTDHLFYPSANLSFVFTDAFQINPAILSSGKLRAAIGETGSIPPPQQTDLSFSFTPVVNGQPGATISNVNYPPSALRPETTVETEVGSQLDLFDARLHLDFAYYYKRSNNFLLPISLPAETGFSGTYQNAGSMTNKGIELLINVKVVRSKTFSWDVTVNYARNKNEVTSLIPSLANGVSYYYNIKAEVGYPLGSIFGVPERRGANGQFLYKAISTDGSNVPNAVVIDKGALSFDKAGNPVTDASGALVVNNNAYLGSVNPDWSGGITNTFRYKSFSLNFLIDGQFGGYVYEDGYRWASFFGNSLATLQGRDGNYIPNGLVNIGTDAAPKYVKNTLPYSPYQQYNSGGTLAYYADEMSVFSRTFIKFRQVSLGYTIPKNVLAGGWVKSLTISLIARNLFFIKKKLPIFDPESSDSIGNGFGYDTGGLPTSRTYGFSLNADF